MSEYIPDPYNVTLACDAALLTSIESGDEAALADALEDGGGSPGSIFLDHLLCVLAGTWRIALLKRAGRPSKQDSGDPPKPDSAWLAMGLPDTVRQDLIDGLRQRRYFLGRPRVTGGAVGRQPDALPPQVQVGAAIDKIANKIISEKSHSSEQALREAKYLWIDQSRQRKGMPRLETGDQQRAAVKRATKAHRAYLQFIDMAEKIQG